MQATVFPSLYETADRFARNARRKFQFTVAAEYSALIIAGFFSLGSGPGVYYVAYALVFIASLAVMLFRTFTVPEQEWYRARAVAEAVASAAWSFMMRADPYAKPERESEAGMRKTLARLLEQNESLVAKMNADLDADEVTGEMRTIRAKELGERKALYFSERIEAQRAWYRAKSAASRTAYRRWIVICTLIYAGAIASVILSAAWPDWAYSPTEPFIIVASSLLGWVQMKKYDELASSYAVAAQQLGLMDGPLGEAESEKAFGAFVNRVELYFSRENTDWAGQGYA